jgi:flagellar biosynthesis/type III secretory pathway protein FliH
MYQINKKINYPHHETSSINMIGRVRYNDISEAINALQLFNCKNCGEGAIEYRKNKILKEYNEHKALNIRSVLTRDKDEAYNRGHDDGRENGYENGYNEGFSEGVISVEEKLNKLLNTL